MLYADPTFREVVFNDTQVSEEPADLVVVENEIMGNVPFSITINAFFFVSRFSIFLLSLFFLLYCLIYNIFCKSKQIDQPQDSPTFSVFTFFNNN